MSEPLKRMEHGVKNDEDDEHRDGHDNQQPPFRALLALVLAFPPYGVSIR
jgi:hypothetical protein